MPGSVATPYVDPATSRRVARNSHERGDVLATRLLTLLLIGSQAGCLVTSEPTFTDPVPSKPIVVGTEPTPTELLRVSGPNNVFSNIPFTVEVTSEDGKGDSAEPLTAVLLIDYGIPTNVGEDEQQPYVDGYKEIEVGLGSFSDAKPRTVTLSWLPKLADPSVPECHSITMLVVRRHFNRPPFNYCPADNPATETRNEGEEFGLVTWYVALCGSDILQCNLNACPKLGDDTKYCPTPAELAASQEAP
jgi:hypothetical protein